jgi:hypothetical protein
LISICLWAWFYKKRPIPRGKTSLLCYRNSSFGISRVLGHAGMMGAARVALQLDLLFEKYTSANSRLADLPQGMMAVS